MKNLFRTIIIIYFIFLIGCQKTEVNNTDDVINPLPQNFHWIPLGLDSNSISTLYQTADGTLLAATNYGLFISADSGSTWTQNNNFSFGIITCFADYNADNLIAGTSNQGVFISSDNGSSWSNIGLSDINITALAVNGNVIFAATRSHGIFKYNSTEWQIAGSDISTKSFFSLLITPDEKIYAGGVGIYRSDDFGQNWHLKNIGLGNWAVLSLITDNSGTVAAGTDNGGFFITKNNGESWKSCNNGLTNIEIISLAINVHRQIFAGTWGGGVFYSIDYGQNWTSINSGLNNKEVQSLFINSEDIIYAGTFKGIFKGE